jgi:UPF0716 protein FxsA
MFAKLLLLFTILPVVELYLLIRVGSAIGALPTVLLVVFTGFLGAYLARAQGFAVWVRIQAETSQGRFPGERLIDALLLLVAGTVLVTPGILTDLVGFVLLFPITRTPIREWVKVRLYRMMQNGSVHFTGFIDR